MRSGLSPGPVTRAASPMAYTSGWESERIVASTVIWPVSPVSRGVARAIGWTAKPVVQMVTAAGMSPSVGS